MQHSAVLIIPAALKTQADAVGQAMGWGPVTFTLPLGDGESVTHWGARADVGAQFIRWVRGIDTLPEGMESAQPVIDTMTADFRPDPTHAGDDPPPVLWGRAHLEAMLAAQGRQITRPDPVNINTDDATTLATRLPGVGAALSQAIVDGRPWADPAELAHVGGISAAMVAGWQSAPGLTL